MKLTKRQLNEIINQFLLSDDTIQLQEGLGDTARLTLFITRITPDVVSIAKDKEISAPVKSIVRKAGSARSAMDNAYEILTSSMVNTVVNLAKSNYQSKIKEYARKKEMTFKEFSKIYPPIDVVFLRKLTSFCNSNYPGVLTDRLISKFRRPVINLMNKLNPHSNNEKLFDLIFKNLDTNYSDQEVLKMYRAGDAIKEPQDTPPREIEPDKKPEENAVEFFKIAEEENYNELQRFIEDFYGYKDQSIDFDSLSKSEIDEMSDEFYNLYGYDPRTSFLTDEDKAVSISEPGKEKTDYFVGPTQSSPEEVKPKASSANSSGNSKDYKKEKVRRIFKRSRKR